MSSITTRFLDASSSHHDVRRYLTPLDRHPKNRTTGGAMPAYRNHLPQLDADVFLTDGGIETTLIFDDGFELPDFAAFTLLADGPGRAALVRYFESYVAIAVRDGVGIILETPTWRASADWAGRLGCSLEELAAINRDAVELLVDIRRKRETASTPIVVSGCVGPRGDGYQVQSTMTVDEARNYHAVQVQTFADTEADLATAITMTYQDEAIGVAEAARAAGMPVVISFTVETDGRLPSGQPLGEAIRAVDAATGSYPAYYMVNCAHPTHFAPLLGGPPAWASRLGGVRANASKLSHAELDEAEELDRGDPLELAARYRELRDQLPALRVLGGCCGTDHRHIDAMSAAFVA
jgi:S-methylmethionine-dependent homocysteine/selenocysteine methylase